MKEEPDYYALLQVNPRAEIGVIQAAYRRLAAKYHPDVDPSPSAGEKMRQLNAAYEVLSDPDKRRAYDLSRESRRPQAPGPGVGLGWLRDWWPLPVALVVMVAALRIKPRLAIFVLLLLGLWLILWKGWKRQR